MSASTRNGLSDPARIFKGAARMTASVVGKVVVQFRRVGLLPLSF
jgi:hypothetical protein